MHRVLRPANRRNAVNDGGHDEKGAERAKIVRSEGAVKEAKIRRSNLPEINAGKRPPSGDPGKDSCGGQ